MTLSRLNPIQPSSHLSMNIVDLATYVYTHTDHLSRSEEPLRKLVSQFVTLNFQALQSEPEAVELVGEGGDFVKDVMAKVCRRLSATHQTLSNPGTRFVSKLSVGILRRVCDDAQV